MKCPNCGGKGKYKNVFGKVDGCYYCLGTGNVNDKGEQVKTEQEYIQTCNTEQLAEVLNKIIEQCFLCGANENNSKKCIFGTCNRVTEWLKQPHAEKDLES